MVCNGATNECGPFSLGNSLNNNNCVTIEVGPQVDDLCGSNLGLLTANVTLTCAGSASPTISTLEPTVEPTLSPTIDTNQICRTGVNSITYSKPVHATQREAARLACEAVYGTCFENLSCGGLSFFYGISNTGCDCFKPQNTYEWIYASTLTNIGGGWCGTNTNVPLNEAFTRVVSPNVSGFICGIQNCWSYVNNYFTDCDVQPGIPTAAPVSSLTIDPSSSPTIEPTSDSRIIRNVFCGETLTGSIVSFGTDFYKLINIPVAITSIELNSCGSGYDTWLQVFDDQFRLIYEWYFIFL